MKQMFGRYMNRKITFNVQGILAQDETLYCAVFCARLLNEGAPKAEFPPLNNYGNNPLYEALPGSKNIGHFPVDFFQTPPFLRKEYKWWKGQDGIRWTICPATPMNAASEQVNDS